MAEEKDKKTQEKTEEKYVIGVPEDKIVNETVKKNMHKYKHNPHGHDIQDWVATQTREQIAENVRKGVKTRTENFKRKKQMKAELEELLSIPLKDKHTIKKLREQGVTYDISNQTLMLMMMIQQVLKGKANCVPAFNSLINVLGEIQQNSDINANLNMTFNNDLPKEDKETTDGRDNSKSK